MEPTVRTFQPHEWRAYRDLRLRALGDSPDAFGSTLAAEGAFPDEKWSARLAGGATSNLDIPLVAEVDGRMIGLAWGKIEPPDQTLAHLYQMWVDPEFRGLGAGRMLLRAAIDWAQRSNAQALVLGVTCGDTAAGRLYSREGFKPDGPPQPLRPGSPVMAQPMRLVLSEPRA